MTPSCNLVVICCSLLGAVEAMAQSRVDALLVQQGLCVSRAAAKLAVSEGRVVTRSGAVIRKASVMLDPNAMLALRETDAAPPAPAAVAEDALPQVEPGDAPWVAVPGEVPALSEIEAQAMLETMAVLAPKRHRTAAARAAEFRNRHEVKLEKSPSNECGLRGRRGSHAKGGNFAPAKYTILCRPLEHRRTIASLLASSPRCS